MTLFSAVSANPKPGDQGSSKTVLLVEDNPDDVLLVGLAFRRLGITNPLQVVPDGLTAVQYLKGEGVYQNREQFPIPGLIFLDLNMPRMSGFEVLQWLRQEPELRHLPVIVLTTSVFSPDVTHAYQLGANSFLIKPIDLTEYMGAVKEVADFWLRRCQLPGPPPEPDRSADAENRPGKHLHRPFRC